MKKGLFTVVLIVGLLVPGVKAENTFPFVIFEKMQQEIEGNVIVSPFSLEQAIGMAANGAQGEALPELLALTGDESLAAMNQRNQELMNLLRQHENDSLSYMRVANSVWHLPMLELMQSFQDSVALRYDAMIDTANFAMQYGIDSVNQWVNDNTDGLIKKILEQPNPVLQVALINATLFHGAWYGNPYDAGKKPFMNADGSGTNVDYVGIDYSSHIDLYLDDDFVGVGVRFAAEDYGSHYLVMFILPRDYQYTGKLTAEKWQHLLQHRQGEMVHLEVPKFDVSFNKDVLPWLQDLGAFVHNDFSGIEPNASVSNVIHSTRMTLDEKGMSAAAVTMIGVATGMPDHIEYVTINRPFYVAIMADGANEPIFLASIKKLEGDACQAPTAQYLTLGVENVRAGETFVKFIRDGKLLIETENGTFDATGRMVE